jgi:hypothetical protein
VRWQPASILDANDLYGQAPVLVFDDTATKDGAMCVFRMPKTYIGTPKFRVVYKTSVNSGNAQFAVDYRAIAIGESGDPTTHQEALGGTAAAVPGTARLLGEQVLTATAGNFAIDDLVYVILSRRGDGSDTVAAALEVIDVVLEWAQS